MRHGENVLRVGAPGKGKTLATARSVAESDGAEVILDPHKESLAHEVLVHGTGNILYANLSDIRHTLGFELLAPSTDPDRQHFENQQRAEAFVRILLRRRDTEGMANTPLMEEWIMAAIMLYLFQDKRKPLMLLPYAFLPGSAEFEALVRDCTLSDIRFKFRQLEKLNPRALRAEVGSATRFINSVFRSPAFAAWCRGGFDLGGFLQHKGKLIVEQGEQIGDDTMRAIMGAINLLVVDHAKQRPNSLPTIRIRIDEATNARLVSGPEIRGAAETNKNGLYWEYNVQKLDFPGDSDAVLQLCHRHEWYGCPHYDLARKAATDVAAGLPSSDISRAERIARLTDEITNLKPGWRWVRDSSGSRKEYVPLLENPWPDWPGLREAKLKEKLQWIYARPEYGDPDTPPSSTSSDDTPPRPPKSPKDSSPAERWRREKRKPADGSSSSDDDGESK